MSGMHGGIIQVIQFIDPLLHRLDERGLLPQEFLKLSLFLQQQCPCHVEVAHDSKNRFFFDFHSIAAQCEFRRYHFDIRACEKNVKSR